MARANLSTSIDDKLSKLISLDQEQKALTKQVKALKEEVVAYMKKEQLTEMSCDKGIIRLSTVVSESFDEEKLIPWLHENGIEVIFLKEYIDYEKLNSIAYDNMDLIKELIAFKNTKETQRVTLRAN